ncbi:hypothetical protein SDC9_183337 [bioreactor metagenome]|uniref:Uncharacterized protein n=1 Tax=bioreactor metagenome TaxID=1076179 RepID=A0A645H9Z1_9ZZZZ
MTAVEHQPAVDIDAIDAKRLGLIGRRMPDFRFVKHRQIGKIPCFDIAAFRYGEAIRHSTGHFADGARQGVIRGKEGELQKLRKAVIDRRVLHAVFLNPSVGHIERMAMARELVDDPRRAIGPHVDAPRKITLLAEHKVCV